MFNLQESIEQLYRITATELPFDVITALKYAKEKEEGNALLAIEKILQNCKISKEKKLPMCQDTGSPIFYVFYPKNFSKHSQSKLCGANLSYAQRGKVLLKTHSPKTYSHKEITNAINKATENATTNLLRPNAVDPLTGKNLETNAPEVTFFEWERDFLQIDLMLKGGGSENASTQYSIPCKETNSRDLVGVKKLAISLVTQLQGKACPPGILGICIGGTRAESMKKAQRQLFRKIPDSNVNKELANFENQLLKEINSLGVGPMGFGGKTTLLAVKAHFLPRHPASFFVSIAYSCWACRRHSLRFSEGVVEFD